MTFTRSSHLLLFSTSEELTRFYQTTSNKAASLKAQKTQEFTFKMEKNSDQNMIQIQETTPVFFLLAINWVWLNFLSVTKTFM